MGSLRRTAVLAFLGVEVGFKLSFVHAYGNAFAPAGDRSWVTSLFLQSNVLVAALWIIGVAALTGRIDRLRRTDTPAARSRLVAALRRLPNQLSFSWCINWTAVTAIMVVVHPGPLICPPAVLCLTISNAFGAGAFAHVLTAWLVDFHLRQVPEPHPTSADDIARSMRRRLSAYVVAMCGAPTAYLASLAFSVRMRAISSPELVQEVLLQAGTIAGFAASNAILLSLSVVGPIRRMAIILQTIARGGEAASIKRMPLLQNDELGELSEATNKMLDRLERSDRERLALLATLERKVEERTALLFDANDQIAREFEARGRMELELRQAQRLEVVGRLAAGIAHEINTPIQFVSDSLEFMRTGISELTQLLDRDDALIHEILARRPSPELVAAAGAAVAATEEADLPYLREQLPIALDRALEGLARVTTIVRSMSHYAHPDRCEMTACDLNKAILSTLTIARNEYKYVAELDTEFGDLPPVTCHVGDFNQVIINLVVNAAHAIGDVVGTSGAKGRLTVKTWCDGTDACVSVADTGAGIPEYIREHIFEPFFTTKAVGKGTGQGLAIARSVIVEKHAGTLTFESTTDEGTTFLIRIPIAGASTAATERAA